MVTTLPSIHNFMDIVYWNCRNVEPTLRNFGCALLDFICSNKPCVLILAETRIHSSCLTKFLTDISFDCMVCSEAQGFVGAYWCSEIRQ